jgi:hypothetical protein
MHPISLKFKPEDDEDLELNVPLSKAATTSQRAFVQLLDEAGNEQHFPVPDTATARARRRYQDRDAGLRFCVALFKAGREYDND